MSKQPYLSQSYDDDDETDPKKRLERLLQQSGNDVCADCSSPAPKWVSTSFGAFVCIKCSGVHRGLGVHITKVVSVNLDEWSDEQVDFLTQSGGNNAVNQKYLSHPPPSSAVPDSDSAIETRDDFIRIKYVLKQFADYSSDKLLVDSPPPPQPQPTSIPGESTQDKKHAFCVNGIKQAIRNSLKWRDTDQAVPNKTKSTAGMVEFVGLLKVKVMKGTNLATRDLLRMTSDPYVIVSLGQQTLRTDTVKNNLNPVWNHTLMLSIPQHIPPLKLVVYDKDTFSSDDYMGEAEIDIEPLFSAAKANADFRNNEAAKFTEEVATRVSSNADSENRMLTETYENVTVSMSVVLQNVEKGSVDIELEIILLTQ